MTQRNFRVRNGLTIDGTTSGSSSFASTATGTDLTYVLPGSQGASSTVLTNDGSGNLTWALPSGGGSTFGNITVAVVDDNTISTTTGDLKLDSTTGIVNVVGDLTVTGNDISTGATNQFITISNLTTATANPQNGLRIRSESTGTPAVGFGSNLEFALETAPGVVTNGGVLQVEVTDITSGSEDFRMNFNLTSNGSSENRMVLDNVGNLQIDGDLTVSGQTINTGVVNSAIFIEREGTATNSAPRALVLKSIQTASAPVVGFGTSLEFQGQTDATTFKQAGYIAVNSTDVTTGSEDFEMNFGLMAAGAAYANKMTLSSIGDLTTAGDLAVNGGDITTTQTTASVFNTTATTVNISGAATTTNIGAKTGSSIINGTNRFTSPTVYGFLGGATSPSRGYMQSNGNAGSFASVRNNLVMRTFPTAAAGARGGLIFENARGNETTPTAIVNGDFIGELSATGYATNGYTSDYVNAIPATSLFYATETWANTGGPYPTAGTVTNAGTGYLLSLQPTATSLTALSGSRINVLAINPQNFAQRSDAFQWSNGKSGTTQTMSLDVSGNLILTGDLRVNGNDIQASDGNTNITLTSNTLTTFAGDLRVNGNDIQSSAGTTALTLSGGSILTPGNLTTTGTATYNNNVAINAITRINPSSSSSGTQVNIKTEYRNTVSDPLVVPQAGYDLGNFRFQSYSDTADTYVLAGSVACQANENWTSTANGSKIIFQAVKIGKAWNDSSFNSVVIDASPDSTTFRSDGFTFNTSAASATKITGNKIDYNRVYGQWQNLNTVTPAGSLTAYAFALPTQDFANISSVVSTSRITPGAAGMYKLQFSVQVQNDDTADEHVAYFWWRKNGTDVPGSMGRVGVFKAKGAVNGLTIAGWDNMISSANATDYWELMYAVDDATHVDFPAFTTTAFGPATSSLFVTLVPIGA